jgi:uncharacterized damage-inducible protein DinB
MKNEVSQRFIEYSREFLKEYVAKIEKSLELLSDEDIWWRPHESDNSVGNLLLHLSGNVRQWIISGVGGAKDTRERQKEFNERRQISKKELLEKLRTTVEEADHVLAGFDVTKLLDVKHIQNYDVTCMYAIAHVVEHFSGHAGQIIYITKLRKGVDLKFYNL